LTDKEPPVPPVEETEEEKAAKAKTVKAGTELTYQQFEDQLTKNTAQVMEACKAAIAEGFKPLEAKN